jgi:hypothetical protein
MLQVLNHNTKNHNKLILSKIKNKTIHPVILKFIFILSFNDKRADITPVFLHEMILKYFNYRQLCA